MGYYHRLAFHLRARKLPESKVAEILQEIQDLSLQSGKDPEQEFGAASSYAKQFPSGDAQSRASRIALKIVYAGFAVLAASLCLGLFGDTQLKIGPLPAVFVVLPIQLAAVVWAVLADRQLPRGFNVAQGHSR